MRPCEDCGAPATNKRNVGGVLQARCPACLALAERQAREDEKACAWLKDDRPVQLELWAA